MRPRIDARWREDADHPEIFAREFLDAIEFLETARGPGSPFPTLRHPMKRLLRKSRCHIYFEIDDPKQAIQILHVWDGRRESAPKF